MARVRIDDDVNQPSSRVMVVVPGLKVQVVQPGTTTAVTVYQAETGGATHTWFGTDARGVVVPFTADPATTGVAIAGGEMWVETGQTVELRVLSVPGGTELGRKRYPLISPSVESGTVGGVFSVTASTYGATGNGTTDDRAAVQAAVTAAAATITATGKGAVVYLPPGVYYFSSGGTPSGYSAASGVSIPVGLTAMLTIRGAGRGATTIKLADTGARNAFYIAKTADYDTFQNVTLEDFDVDNNNANGRCHVIIGNRPASDTPQGRLNFADINVRRIRAYNVPVDLTQTTSYKCHVQFLGSHTSALEATQTSSRRIVCEDVEMYGGDNGLNVCSYGAGSLVGGTNHYYDQIFFRRCRHEITATPTATSGQTSYYVCGSGYGDYFKIEDCHSTNISDDAIEVGTMQRGEIVDCSATDPFLVGILFRHSHALLRAVDQQKIIVRNFRVRVTTALTAITGALGRPFNFIDDGTFTFGNFSFEDLEWAADGLTYSKQGQTTIGVQIDKDVRHVALTRPKFVLTNYSYDSNTVQDVLLIKVATPTAGNRVTLRDLDVRGTGFLSSSTGNVFLQLVSLQGTSGVYAIDGFSGEFTGNFGAGGGGLLWIGPARGGGTLLRAVIRRFVPVSATATSGVNIGITAGSGTVSSLVIADCDFTGPSWSSEITITNLAASSQERVQTVGNTYKTPPAPSTVTVSTSPWTFQNLTGRTQAYTITGGTVSKIEYGSKASASTFQDTGLISGSFVLDPGSRLKVTHSVTPTMTNMPLS